MLHLHTSNQSPETFQCGILLLLLVAAAAIAFGAKGTILVFYISQLKQGIYGWLLFHISDRSKDCSSKDRSI
jgi:hypothetical protein